MWSKDARYLRISRRISATKRVFFIPSMPHFTTAVFIEVQEIMRDSHSDDFRRELKALEIDKTVVLPSKNRQDRGTAIGHLVHLIVPIGEPNEGDLC